MRILLLTEFYGEAPGGVETHIRGLEEELNKMGHQLAVVCPNRKRWEWLIGKRPLLRALYFFLNGLPLIFTCDRIYTIYTISPMLAGVMLKIISGKHLVAGIWNTEALEKISGSPMLKNILDRSDEVIFFTHAHKELYPRGNVIPNWFDPKLFKPGKSAIRLKLHWEKKFVIVFVGRPTKGKGLQTLFEAVKRLDCRLLVVGSFIEDDYFKKLAKELGIAEKVHFIGKVAHDSLPDFYRAADVFCVPSTIFEGQGIVFIEAMACGKPIVTTNVPAVRETVGKAALLVGKEAPDELTSALRKLMDSRQLRRKLSGAALAQAHGFSKPLVMQKYLKVLLKG